MHRHSTRSGSFLIMTILWFASLWASAQDLQGQFYPEKDNFMLGEPVLFNVEIKNTGEQFVYISARNSSTCLDSYDFSVSASGSTCSLHNNFLRRTDRADHSDDITHPWVR